MGMKRTKMAMYALVVVAVASLGFFFYHRNQHKHDGLARCLKERGAKMYGAYWCPHCIEQKEAFGSSLERLGPYVECGVQGDLHGQAQVCKDEGIKHYPTWQFPPTGERVERVLTLEELSERTGCSVQ